MHTILREKGIRDEDPFIEVVTRATVTEIPASMSWIDVVQEASNSFTHKYPMLDARTLANEFIESINDTYVLSPQGAVILNLRSKNIDHTEIVILRSQSGITIDGSANGLATKEPMHAIFFVISPETQSGQHLRIIAELINHIETDDFAHTWSIAHDEQEIKEILLHSERLLTLWLDSQGRTASLIGKPLRDLGLPDDTLIALIRRDNQVLIPRGSTSLIEGDRITIIGLEDDIKWLYEEYVGEHLPS